MKLFATLLTLCLAVVVSAQSNAIDAAVDEPSQEYLPPAEEANAAKLAEDGYRYKTVRKLKYRARHRRDVSQEYLPPVNEPNQEYLPPSEEKAETKLADDGYRYRTVHKLKLRSRHRRDVSQEYLPPVNEPTQEYLPPGEEKAEDGYRYKTVRTLKFRSRHRRDVSEIEKPSKDYLPPVDVELAPDLKTVLGDDGYRYKTVRRLKLRRHRREADMPAADNAAAAYLPPAEEMPADAAAADMPETKSAELAQDGYRYKTVRRIRYRYRQ
ncbi:uncharacterized protein LOC106089779 [Stomoxys calcitrans]|uniref:Uncharacterized protein n=1 Tax=Stomoxys calcitrans TaxID=35570 RepID=A0A1I8PZ53_STOCA|nr:uncharacterized protein LOC106089779 [Stomoxys calcitrans]